MTSNGVTEKTASSTAKLWKKIGITWPMFFTMLRGASSPTIAIALFQYPPFNSKFTTLGYLIAIVAILSMSIMPRAKFIETLLLNLMATVVAIAVSLLICYSVAQARILRPSQSEYNSSASAVSGAWLFFNIMFSQAARFANHKLHLPMILYSIIANIIGTFAPIFPTFLDCALFIRSLLEAYLAGFGIAAVTHIIFPRSSRDVSREQFVRYARVVRLVLRKQLDYLAVIDDSTAAGGAAAGVKAATVSLVGIHSQTRSDLAYAKKEFAIGKLTADDFEQIFLQLRAIYGPLTALTSTPDIVARIEQHTSVEAESKENVISALLPHLHNLFDAINKGLDHALQLYQIGRSFSTDIDGPTLQKCLDEFEATKREILPLPSELSSVSSKGHEDSKVTYQELAKHICFLVETLTKSVADFIETAEDRQSQGFKTHLVIPGIKWLGKTSEDTDTAKDLDEELLIPKISYLNHSDLEHLSPTNDIQKAGTWLRKVLSIFGSLELACGFRVAVATLSISIIGFIQSTQGFFIQERLVWTPIMISLSMTLTTGSGVYGFLSRTFGSIFATCTSLAIWYIAGGRGIPGAVLPLVGIVALPEIYIMLKYPKFTIACIITLITQVLILGYELGADKIGEGPISSDGSIYYPIYLLAPFRLLTVVAGLATALIWTYFPYPVTARNALRMQLGKITYLLANYHSELQRPPSSFSSTSSSNNALKASIHAEIVTQLPQVKQHFHFAPFEISLGGSFPSQVYERIVLRVQRILADLMLLDLLPARTDQDSYQITSQLIMISSSLMTGAKLPLRRDGDGVRPSMNTATASVEHGEKMIVARIANMMVVEDVNVLFTEVQSLVGKIR